MKTSSDEDAKIKNLVKGIDEIHTAIDNLSIDDFSKIHGHRKGYEQLENEIVMIQKAKLDMQMIKLGDELKETLKKKDLKKELEDITSRIASTYMLKGSEKK